MLRHMATGYTEPVGPGQPARVARALEPRILLGSNDGGNRVTGRVVQVSVSQGGVPKLPVAEAQVTENGVAGDAQNDTKNHGGPEQAVCVFALEVIDAINADGHELFPGAAGENLTFEGLDWQLVVPGARLRVGEVELEITRYTTPCYKNAEWFAGGDFNRMHQNLFPGSSRMYARVLQPGVVRPGDPVELLSKVPA